MHKKGKPLKAEKIDVLNYIIHTNTQTEEEKEKNNVRLIFVHFANDEETGLNANRA